MSRPIESRGLPWDLWIDFWPIIQVTKGTPPVWQFPLPFAQLHVNY
jgi:hypothetical protein